MDIEPTPHTDAGLRVIEELIEEGLPFHCNLIQLDEHTWALHGSIAVDGDSILAEFCCRADAEAALARVRAAGLTP